MKKRDFIKCTAMAGFAAALPFPVQVPDQKKQAVKHWVWVRPNDNDEASTLDNRYDKYYAAGIRGIFFEADSEKHFKAAKRNRLEAHRWMWTMNRGEKELLALHPDWYAVSRTGGSCATHPPYVDYYRWLCPSRPEVSDYLDRQAKLILQKDYVDGLHLDYVRFCDVVLPVNLWEKYGIVQDRELPEYDFCYCNVCRAEFNKRKGIDPMDLEYPAESLSWRKFRYNQVTSIVNRLAQSAASYNKPISAAVFPTPEVARRLVRQDWTRWNLNSVFPMIYHGFYKEEVAWIGEAVTESLEALCGRFPVYAGLFLPDFKNEAELKQGIELAMANGATGVSLFGDISDKVLSVLKTTKGG